MVGRDPKPNGNPDFGDLVQSIALGTPLNDLAGVEEFIAAVIGSPWWHERVQYQGLISVELGGFEDYEWVEIQAGEGIQLGDGPLLDPNDPDDLARLGDDYDPVTHRVRLGSGIGSFARPHGHGPHANWTISLHPRMCNDLIVLHELAHCAAPRLVPSARRRRRGYVPSSYGHPFHGEHFSAVMAALTDEFATAASADELRDAYRHFEVPLAAFSEYQTAVEQKPGRGG